MNAKLEIINDDNVEQWKNDCSSIVNEEFKRPTTDLSKGMVYNAYSDKIWRV